MMSLVEAASGPTIGTVESVAPDEIRVMLNVDAPQATALNTGSLTGFPRLNGYVLVPSEGGFTVGVIGSIRIERLAFPKRKGFSDFGLVDLPFPARIMTVVPLGTLITRTTPSDKAQSFELRRGVDVFPSVGDPVMLPSPSQLRSMVEGESREDGQRIRIGVSSIAGGGPVYVDPDKMFGRHLAVLGNTGSGKSCSVAGLIRWSWEAALRTRQAAPNARFIILDPNAEYQHAFNGIPIRRFRVSLEGGSDALKVPAWLWNGDEWTAFAGAAPGVQRPVLMQALRRLRAAKDAGDPALNKARTIVRRFRLHLNELVRGREHLSKGKREGFATFLVQVFARDLSALAESLSDGAIKDLILKAAKAGEQLESEAKQGTSGYHREFGETGVQSLMAEMEQIQSQLGEGEEENVSEDAPVPFDVKELPEMVEQLGLGVTGRDLATFIDTLKLRIKGLFSEGRLAPVAAPEKAPTLVEWLRDYIGDDNATNGPITVLDLSLVPSDVVHVIVAVVARMVFEALQRYRRLNGNELPTILVLEEAHSFIHRDALGESATASSRLCCRVLERIAREGRKFGMGLVLSSQRPSELSPTVLSQCNTFLLHRIVNDQDQTLVRRLVPDGLGDLLRDLPSLPARRAILLGWAAPAPILVEMTELPFEHRPRSPDPAFWAVWTSQPGADRKIDWEALATDWQGSTE